MGWVSYLEDIQRRLDDAQAELSLVNCSQPAVERRKKERRSNGPDLRKATELIGALRTAIDRLKADFDKTLDLLTTPGSPILHLEPNALHRLTAENATLKARLLETMRDLEDARSELARSRMHAREAEARLEATLKNVELVQDEHAFLKAVGGQNLLDSRVPNRKRRRRG